MEAQIFFPKLITQLSSFTFFRKKGFYYMFPRTLTLKVIYLTSTALSNSHNKQQLFASTQ